MSKAVLIIFIVPLNYCVALFAHPSQKLPGPASSPPRAAAPANGEMSGWLRPLPPPVPPPSLNLSGAAFLGPAASPPLHADLNFLINTFSAVAAKGEGRRFLGASIQTLLASCGTPL